MAVPEDRNYTAEHEWVRFDGDTATVGITAYAADKLGDVVFVELPAVGSTAVAGKVVGEIESTKSVGEIFAPLNGTIAEINDAVVDAPELVNGDPFEAGWLVKITVHGGGADVPGMLSAEQYTALVGE
ncbi:glycine cleavage system protein GcvH [Leifsonia sp. Root112D2]|jgi:glycine cleavage system H protein|uniref:glycine cleavage system protein GcvH n=1 Tax=Leifsonia sp. Root112D2 TaxID=1736426 RepID=UPI0007000ABD|nr:glycine cleavage system protein GcvH [Leifsonia sp. Root112D2]KQV07543.1 glycine cleavage system protein H [Leifsonia sp. Root112D2]